MSRKKLNDPDAREALGARYTDALKRGGPVYLTHEQAAKLMYEIDAAREFAYEREVMKQRQEDSCNCEWPLRSHARSCPAAVKVSARAAAQAVAEASRRMSGRETR